MRSCTTKDKWAFRWLLQLKSLKQTRRMKEKLLITLLTNLGQKIQCALTFSNNHLLRNYLLFSFATNKFSLEFCKIVLDNRVIQSNYSYKKLCPWKLIYISANTQCSENVVVRSQHLTTNKQLFSDVDTTTSELHRCYNVASTLDSKSTSRCTINLVLRAALQR